MKSFPSIKKIERAIGTSTHDWRGRCYEIAQNIIEAKLVKGVAIYGMYHGPIAETGYFAGRKFARHGWIKLEDGRIFDPTRWVFDNVKPYLYVGVPIPGEYDEGANAFRTSINPERGSLTQAEFELVISIAARGSEALLARYPDKAERNQVCLTLANKNYEALGPAVYDVYDALKALDLSVFIPIDNRRRAERERPKS